MQRSQRVRKHVDLLTLQLALEDFKFKECSCFPLFLLPYILLSRLLLILGKECIGSCLTNVVNAYTALPCSHFGQSDHISLLMLLAYKPLISRIKPTIKTVRVWPEGALSQLQDCFEQTDWSVFAGKTTSRHQLCPTLTSAQKTSLP